MRVERLAGGRGMGGSRWDRQPSDVRGTAVGGHGPRRSGTPLNGASGRVTTTQVVVLFFCDATITSRTLFLIIMVALISRRRPKQVICWLDA